MTWSHYLDWKGFLNTANLVTANAIARPVSVSDKLHNLLIIGYFRRNSCTYDSDRQTWQIWNTSSSTRSMEGSGAPLHTHARGQSPGSISYSSLDWMSVKTTSLKKMTTIKDHHLMEEEKTITPRDLLLCITSAIILAGIVSNYSSVGPSSSHIYRARSTASDLVASILDGQKL